MQNSRGQKPKISFPQFLGLMVREAIEPIILTSGLALLYSRFQIVSDEVYLYTGSQDIWDISSAFFRDMEAHRMVYGLLIIILLVWIVYRAWKLRQEKLRDAQTVSFNEQMLEIHKTQTEILNKLTEGMVEIMKSLKDIHKRLNDD